MLKSFKQKVLEIVQNIPKGKMLSYKEVAILAGNRKAYRAVGSVLKKNYNPEIPCHRVICSNGELGEYKCGRKEKIKKPKIEGAI